MNNISEHFEISELETYFMSYYDLIGNCYGTSKSYVGSIYKCVNSNFNIPIMYEVIYKQFDDNVAVKYFIFDEHGNINPVPISGVKKLEDLPEVKLSDFYQILNDFDFRMYLYHQFFIETYKCKLEQEKIYIKSNKYYKGEYDE